MDINDLYWSGREDSNLRPLPPERIAPERTQAFKTAFPDGPLSLDGTGSHAVHGRRFKLNFRPLSILRLKVSLWHALKLRKHARSQGFVRLYRMGG